MPELFLTGNRILEITPDQSLYIAKCILLMPEWRKLKIGDTTFRIDEIDPEAQRLSKLPKQESFGLRVPVVDKPEKKSKKSIDFAN